MEDSDDLWVTLKFHGSPEVVSFRASDETDSALEEKIPAIKDEIEHIADAIHHAYIQATEKFLNCKIEQ